MTITTDASIDFFESTVGTAIDTGSNTIADGAFSAGTSDIISWTNTDDAPYAVFTLEIDTTSARSANRTIGLYAKMMNITGTAAHDAATPDATHPHTFIGNFYPDDSADAQFMPGDFYLPNTVTQQVYEFYLWNNCGQTLLAGWELWVMSKSRGPHA